jgi:hypothetical protein
MLSPVLWLRIVGIFSLTKDQTQGHSLQMEGSPEGAFQITFVGTGQTRQLVPMKHQGDGVLSPLVTVTQLDASSTHHGWLMGLDHIG